MPDGDRPRGRAAEAAGDGRGDRHADRRAGAATCARGIRGREVEPTGLSFRAVYERFPVAIKGAFVLRAADGEPHQVRIDQRVAQGVLGAVHRAADRRVRDPRGGADAGHVRAVRGRRPWNLDPGWYALECRRRRRRHRGDACSRASGSRSAGPAGRCARARSRLAGRSATRPSVRLECAGDSRADRVRRRGRTDREAVGGRSLRTPSCRSSTIAEAGAGRSSPIPCCASTPSSRSRQGRRSRGDPAPVGVSAVTGTVAAMWIAALDAVFPRSCAGCGRGPWPFCDRCAAALQPLGPPWCARCGRPSILDVSRLPRLPAGTPSHRRARRSSYAGPARRAVHRLKFSGWRDVASALARGDAHVSGRCPRSTLSRGCPSRARRLAERGYDQARALATAVAREQAECRSSACSAGARRHRSAGAARRHRPAPRGAGCVHGREGGAAAGPVRRRRPHHGRDGGGVRRRARPRRAPARSTCWPRRGRSTTAPPRCVSASRPAYPRDGPSSGSVVARGSSPVVDASRGRNDPRKATVGG